MEERIAQLEKRIADLEQANNVVFLDSLSERTIKDTNEFDSTGISGTIATNPLLRTITVPAGGGTFDILNAPNNFIEYRYKGKVYRIPTYNF
jgi:hypothetical protein